MHKVRAIKKSMRGVIDLDWPLQSLDLKANKLTWDTDLKSYRPKINVHPQ